MCRVEGDWPQSPKSSESLSTSSPTNPNLRLERAPRGAYPVESWQRRPTGMGREAEWTLVRSVVPTRRGRPLESVPCMFPGRSVSDGSA
jgi:hypothetical protein